VRSRSETPFEVKGFTTRGRGWEWRQSWFLLLFFTYFLYWAPLVYMGLRVLRLRWVFYAFLYAGPGALLALMLLTAGATREAIQAAPGGVDAALAAHAGAIQYLWYTTNAFLSFALIHTWLAREEFLMLLADQYDERDQRRELARAKRQDLEMEATATRPPPAPKRLLQVNTVSEVELAMLPGMGPERARQALQLRAQQGGFRSFGDFCEQLQLAVPARERLRALFEPDPVAAPPQAAPDDPAFRVLPDGRRTLELNWASAETLATLPGLGPELARRAVTLRGDGPFKSLEDFRFRLNLPVDVMIRISPLVSVISMSTRPGGGTDTKTGGRIVDV